MRYLFILIGLISLFHDVGSAQIQRRTFKGYLVGINGGFNFSHLNIDSVMVSTLPQPNVGLNVETAIRNNFSLRLGAGYARRGVNSVDNLLEYRNDYFDLQLLARYKAGNRVKFSAGVQRSGLINSKVKQYYDSYYTDYRWYVTRGFSTQYELQLGMSVALMQGMDLEAHYRVNPRGHDYKTFQVSATIYISELKVIRKLNKFISLEEARKDPFAVEKLVLHRQGLKEIPQDVYAFPNLQELVLDGNDITFVSPEIGNLKNLKILSLQYNQINSLPSEIGKLNKLEELRLNRNQLQQLPVEIGQCWSLKFLYVGKNNLSGLPDELSLLSNLIELDVAHSGVMLQIPESLQKLKRLEVLYIDNTAILPYSIVNFNPRLVIVYK